MSWIRDMNPTLRGLLVILAVAVAITLLQLQVTLVSLLLIARVAFFLAITFFLFLLWRERREDIATWPARPRTVLYGAVALALVDVGAAILSPWPSGALEVLVFFFVLAGCGFAAWRVWSQQHTYGY